jgi:hypothetical protein
MRCVEGVVSRVATDWVGTPVRIAVQLAMPSVDPVDWNPSGLPYLRDVSMRYSRMARNAISGSITPDCNNDRELRQAGGARRLIASTSLMSPIDSAADGPHPDSLVIVMTQMAPSVTLFEGPTRLDDTSRPDRLTRSTGNQPSD